MLACVPTLLLFARRRRYADLVLYSTGFLVAVIYHSLHLAAHGGLASVRFWGISGAHWRTLDILSANLLLARTMGHALGVDHPIIALIPNVGLPLAIVVALVAVPRVDLRLVGPLTAGTCVVTAVAQLVVDTNALLHHAVKKYTREGVLRATASVVLGLFSFAMPATQPDAYWAWHSLWHLFMGYGYWELYTLLEGLHWSHKGAGQGRSHLATRTQAQQQQGKQQSPRTRGRAAITAEPREALAGLLDQAGGETAGVPLVAVRRGRSPGRGAGQAGRSRSRARSLSRARAGGETDAAEATPRVASPSPRKARGRAAGTAGVTGAAGSKRRARTAGPDAA